MSAHIDQLPQTETKTFVHEIIFNAVMCALKIAQPKLPEADATFIASNAAISASAQIDVLVADFIKRLDETNIPTAH